MAGGCAPLGAEAPASPAPPSSAPGACTLRRQALGTHPPANAPPTAESAPRLVCEAGLLDLALSSISWWVLPPQDG